MELVVEKKNNEDEFEIIDINKENSQLNQKEIEYEDTLLIRKSTRETILTELEEV